MHRRRVWCETVPADELAAPATAALLARYGVEPILAVWPDTVDEARRAAARFLGAGLRPALWPMLPDEEGRWLNAGNAAAFSAFAERVAGLAEPGAEQAIEIVLDLEPPIAALRGGLAGLLFAVPDASRAAGASVSTLVTHLRDAGVLVSAAVPLPLLFHPAWQFALGTPVFDVAWDHVSPMLYSSMIEGWSRGLLARDDARAILAASCRAALRRFGPAAGASLGAVGTGALGDEPTYRAPAELADDVSVARAAGVDDLALFDLGGALRRPPADAWLEAFAHAEPAACVSPPTWRARAAIAGMMAGGAVLGLLPHTRLPRDPG